MTKRNLLKEQDAQIRKRAELFLNSKIIPAEVYNELPDFLKRVSNCYSEYRQKDIALLGSLSLLSACFPSVYTNYNQSYYPNLFGAIVAPPGSGKGAIATVRRIGLSLHKKLRRGEVTFDKDFLFDFDNITESKGRNSQSLFLAADTSAAAFKKSLANNNGIGFMCETEIDTIVIANGREYGGYDDLIRKAAEHEPISSNRVEDGVLEIPVPKLSVILSGTPNQFKKLFPSTENGLVSRFFFYFFGGKDKWVSMFGKGKKEGKIIKELSEELVVIYEFIKGLTSLEIQFTDKQQFIHKDYFSKLQNKINGEILKIESSTLKRMGVITLRISMIFTALRIYENRSKYVKKVFCSDKDFDIAMKIMKVLMQHQRIAMLIIPKTSVPQNFSVYKSKFYKDLPHKFDKAEATLIAEGIGIPLRTSAQYLTDFIEARILERLRKGHYKKI